MVAKGSAPDAKMERLLNLVIALLGTRKFLTKSQITTLVPGYEGTSEARDRMFERDKDDLRKIGINIEVKQLDPLFDDEVGYRIKRDDYQIQIPQLTAEEGVLAATALTLMATLQSERDFRSTRMRIGSLIPPSPTPMDKVLSITEGQILRTPAFAELLSAIRERSSVFFDYVRDSDSVRSRRHVEPLRLMLRNQDWLLEAWDLERRATRFFIVENIVGDVLRGESFEEREEHRTEPVLSGDDSITAVEILTHPDLDDLMVAEGGEKVGEEDGKSRFLFKTYNFDRLQRILLSLDPFLEIDSPAECASAFAALKEKVINAI